MAATAALRENLHFDVQNTLVWFQRTPTVRYGFCSVCGSTLFWEAADKDSITSIAAGTLDQPTGLTTVLAIWAEGVSDFHCLDNAIETHLGDVPDYGNDSRLRKDE